MDTNLKNSVSFECRVNHYDTGTLPNILVYTTTRQMASNQFDTHL